MKDVSVIELWVWGRFVGAVTLDPSIDYYAFEYDPAWKRTGTELAPIHMPLKDSRSVYVFPTLPEATYFRLPALLADALPDDFGNALIDAWMAQRGIAKSSVTASHTWENEGWAR
jgi:serine/threonine-protein kinase HipA